MFDLDSPLMRALSKLVDIVILNLLFVLCSLPIITIGASWTALYSVMRKLVKDEEGHIVSGFFKAFRANFRQSTILWLILLAFGVLLGLAFYLTVRLGMVVLNRLLFAVLFLYCVELSYIFPLVSQFDAKTMTQLRNAMMIGIANLPLTVVILLIDLLPVILMLVSTKLMLLVPPVMLFLGFGLIAFCGCYLFNHIFQRYMPPAEDGSE